MLTLFAAVAAAVAQPPPIIDMHFHALGAADQGPPPTTVCAPYENWPIRDPVKPIDIYMKDFMGSPDCRRKITSPMTDAELNRRNVEALNRRNMIAVTSGEPDRVALLHKLAPERVIEAVAFGEASWPALDQLRALHKAGRLHVMGEILTQYGGTAPDSTKLEPYYALAEELDIPVAIHIGPGPPGVVYFGSSNYRMRLSNPLALEDVLTRHPRLRLYVMHSGWPMGDQMIGLLYSYPQVYVDVGVIDWVLPSAEFESYIKRLVEAGFGKRIMFGSDQMVWPDAIEIAVRNIQQLRFLTPLQKRDILYNNAARFLRLEHSSPAPATRPNPRRGK